MESKHSSNSNLGNGFLLGVIVGAIVTLLFTTKKGRQILNRLTEEGKDQVAVLQDRLGEVRQQVVEEVEEFGENIFGSEEEQISPKERPLTTKPVHHSEEEESSPKKVIKKFFKKS